MSDEELVIMPMPSLVALLLSKEQEKGSPLTEAEVIEIRDNAVCTMTPPDVVARIAEARGYDDIDPENAWEDWIAIRPSLGQGQRP
ncbi:hypothetical protein ACSBM8_02510 [Sphingomonas sp. ASY06-1R]|jgi:hypothetical protein|uniref:hypothetical protein n=1 Tax=Sphingomonas sp. ASY06-1R TaxID=3445771 RepID=UPI003FA29040